jgi:SPP1 family predicted phage head-tail adaptor
MTSRITIQRATQTVVAGAIVNAWADVQSCAAKMEWQSATESVQSDQVTVARTVSGQCRYSPAIATIGERDRIVWNGVNLSVNAWLPLPSERPDIINFTATAAP